jgi:SAM-dependent methyltransferase
LSTRAAHFVLGHKLAVVPAQQSEDLFVPIAGVAAARALSIFHDATAVIAMQEDETMPNSVLHDGVPLAVTVEIGDDTWRQYDAGDQLARTRLAFDLERLRDLFALATETVAGDRVLELGAAPYLLTTALVQAGYRVTANGLPVTTQPTSGVLLIKGADPNVWRMPVRLFDLEEAFPLADASFDMIVAGEVFEHLYRQPWIMLHEAHRCLRPGGRIVMSTPNGHALEALHRWLRRTSTGLGFNPEAPSVRHAREYGVEELRELLEVSGFRVDRILTKAYSHVGTDGFPGTLGPAKRWLAAALRRRAEHPSGPLSQRGNTVLISATRVEGREPAVPGFMRYAISDPRTGYNFGG